MCGQPYRSREVHGQSPTSVKNRAQQYGVEEWAKADGQDIKDAGGARIPYTWNLMPFAQTLNPCKIIKAGSGAQVH